MSRFSSISLGGTDLPTAAVEITSNRVSAAAIERRGSQFLVSAHASEALPAGALTPSLVSENIQDRPGVLAALRGVLGQIGRPRRVGLIIPDPVAKVSLIKFEQVPARARELEELLRWQVKKSSPFPVEDAVLSYQAGAPTPEGQEFLVTCARRAAVLEYESLCTEAGVHAGIVDLSTFNVANAAIAAIRPVSVDWLLVNVAVDWASIVIMRGANVVLYRSRSVDADGTLADLAHQTAMYYEDRLGGAAFSAVMLCGASHADGADPDDLRRTLEGRLGTAVTQVDPRVTARLTDRIVSGPALLDTLTPLVGLLIRDRQVAA